MSPAARVIALTGSRDATTVPALAMAYVEGLQARGIDAVFRLVADAGHVDVLGAPALSQALAELLRR